MGIHFFSDTFQIDCLTGPLVDWLHPQSFPLIHLLAEAAMCQCLEQLDMSQKDFLESVSILYWKRLERTAAFAFLFSSRVL